MRWPRFPCRDLIASEVSRRNQLIFQQPTLTITNVPTDKPRLFQKLIKLFPMLSVSGLQDPDLATRLLHSRFHETRQDGVSFLSSDALLCNVTPKCHIIRLDYLIM